MVTKNELKHVAQLTLAHQPLVVLTGAGISVASGIPDFRSPGGLWETFDPFDYASMRSFRKNPKRVWEMLFALYESIGDPQPNAGHLALAKLENAGFLEAVVTQNIDSLHQKAGSQEVVEFHGNGTHFHCVRCEYSRPVGEFLQTPAFERREPPTCGDCERILKPSVVFFWRGNPS